MTKNITCPNCKNKFNTKQYLKYQINSIDSFVRIAAERVNRPFLGREDIIDSANLIVCPKCGNEFESKEYRILGVMTSKATKISLIIFLCLFIAYIIYSTLAGKR